MQIFASNFFAISRTNVKRLSALKPWLTELCFRLIMATTGNVYASFTVLLQHGNKATDSAIQRLIILSKIVTRHRKRVMAWVCVCATTPKAIFSHRLFICSLKYPPVGPGLNWQARVLGMMNFVNPKIKKIEIFAHSVHVVEEYRTTWVPTFHKVCFDYVSSSRLVVVVFGSALEFEFLYSTCSQFCLLYFYTVL